jgi:ferredoxin
MAEKKQKTYKVSQEHEKCIGCGACVSLSDNWEIGNDGKARPKKTTITEKELKSNKDAENSCPVHCIHVK